MNASSSQPITAEPAGAVSIEQNSINLNNNRRCLPQTNQNCQSLYYLNFVVMLLNGEPFGIVLTVLYIVTAF